MSKRYKVYIVSEDFVPIEFRCTHFKITAWLLTRKIECKYSLNSLIYDRKKGEIIYEK